jgi:hypothetical protein
VINHGRKRRILLKMKRINFQIENLIGHILSSTQSPSIDSSAKYLR